MKEQFKFISGLADLNLGKKISKELGAPLEDIEISHFQDGEIKIKLNEVTRNSDYYVLQSTCISPERSLHDNVMELFLLIRTLKRNSVSRVIAIIPYFGYGRQDRQVGSKEAISAADLALLFESAGADQIISIDLHCGQIQGFFQKIPVENLAPSHTFVKYMAEKKLSNPVVTSPDAGGVARASIFRDHLSNDCSIKANMAVMIKQRSFDGKISNMTLVGSVKDSDVIIVDDICDTAGTLIEAAKIMKSSGAKRVFACVTHPVFSGDALEKIGHSQIDELIVSDSIPMRHKLPKNVTQVSIAPLIADTIKKFYK